MMRQMRFCHFFTNPIYIGCLTENNVSSLLCSWEISDELPGFQLLFTFFVEDVESQSNFTTVMIFSSILLCLLYLVLFSLSKNILNKNSPKFKQHLQRKILAKPWRSASAVGDHLFLCPYYKVMADE